MEMRISYFNPYNLLNIILNVFMRVGIVFLLSNRVQSDSQPYGGALLKIEWDYNNPGSLLENGQACDRVGAPECDVYFTLCLRNAASVTTE
ncbi:unnamed protein product [Trichobilharzia szidati]|nr:unnamed protein product [Trichobilharzia szidati]